MFKSTSQVARILGISASRLGRAVWEERVDPPTRGPSGAFLWTDADIERASWALLHRSADRALEAQAQRIQT